MWSLSLKLVFPHPPDDKKKKKESREVVFTYSRTGIEFGEGVEGVTVGARAQSIIGVYSRARCVPAK